MSSFKLADNVSVLTDFADGYSVYDSRYVVSGGVSGGQTLKGGTASGDDLTLQSTNHATKGSILFGAAGNSVYDEVNERWAFGTTAFTSGYTVKSAGSVLVDSSVNNSGFIARFTGSSSASVGPQNGFMTNDGAALGSQDRLGALLFGGYDGSTERNAAIIIAQANQDWSDTQRASKITFHTTPNGSTTMTIGMTLEHDGSLTLLNNLNLGGTYRVDGTQVVSNRRTGWGAPTGTATRSAFATSTVTLPQLAERVKALLDDLTTHGLIGA